MLRGKRVHQIELRCVRVLIFIHHDVAIFRAASCQRFRMLREKSQRKQNQIIKIHCVAGAQRRFIVAANMLGHCAGAFVGENCGALTAILETAEQVEERRGIGFLTIRGNPGKNLLDRPNLFGFIVNDKVTFVPQLLDVLPKNADAQRVKSADGWSRI